MMQTAFLATMANLPIPSVPDEKLSADLGSPEEVDAFLDLLTQPDKGSASDLLALSELCPLVPVSSQNCAQQMVAPCLDETVLAALTIADGTATFDASPNPTVEADFDPMVFWVENPPKPPEADTAILESGTVGDVGLIKDALVTPLGGFFTEINVAPILPDGALARDMAEGAPVSVQAATQDKDLVRTKPAAATPPLEQSATAGPEMSIAGGPAPNAHQPLPGADPQGQAGAAPQIPKAEPAIGLQSLKSNEPDRLNTDSKNTDQVGAPPFANGAQKEGGDVSQIAKPEWPVSAPQSSTTARPARSSVALPDAPETGPFPTAGHATPGNAPLANATLPERAVIKVVRPDKGASLPAPPQRVQAGPYLPAVAKSPKHVPTLARLTAAETEFFPPLEGFVQTPLALEGPQPKHATAHETAFHLRAAAQSIPEWQAVSGPVSPTVDRPSMPEPANATLPTGDPQSPPPVETVRPPDDLTHFDLAATSDKIGPILASEVPADQLTGDGAMLRGVTPTEIEPNPAVAVFAAKIDEAVSKTALPTQLQPIAAKPFDAPSPIQQTVAILATQNSEQPGTIELVLTPETLGRMHFDMRPQGDAMAITLSAERPETLDLMRRHLPELLAELKQAGVQAGTLSFGTWSEGRQQPPAPPEAVTDTQAIDVTHIRAEPTSIRPTLAVAGGLDLRF